MKRRVWITVMGLLAPLALAQPVPAQAAPSACDPATKLINLPPSAFAQLGMTAAWRLSTGKGVRVAVVDSGVDASNPHLRDAVDPGTSFVGVGNGQSDTFGTGTAIASLIAARPVKGSGLTGVAPGVRIVPVKVFESTETGKANPTPARTAQGIRWAANQPGVRVIVVAQTVDTDSAVLRSAVNAATNSGALVVAAVGEASGDNSDKVSYPAGYDEAVAVTAVDASGVATTASRRGGFVELAAPGSQVLAAHKGGDCVFAADKPATQYAAGYAAGVAALVAAAHPNEKPADWQYRLLVTALRPSPGVRNTQTGWGLIAPYDAINFVNDAARVGPANPRYPAPAGAASRSQPQPVPTPANTTPLVVISVVTSAAIALVAGGLLVGRLRRSPTPPVPGRERG